MLGGPVTSCIGFACGIGRIVQALTLEDVKLPIKEDLEVYVMYVSDTEKKYASSLVQYLRGNGFRVDTDYGNRSMKAQFKQADRLNSKYLIILNDEDLKNDEVKIKNNKTKKEDLVSIDYLIYYLDEALGDDLEEFEHDECECEHDECDCDGDSCACKHDTCTCGHHHEEGEDIDEEI